ncbi:Uncharacterized protein SCF082_LOCUS17693, partial [Durusdinium trenchii]
HIDALTLAVCLVEHGLVADWNAVNPGCAIEPGDRLVSVNGLCHPELVLEQLFGEPSLRIVVEKRGGFTGALVPHCKFSVELRRTALEGFGMDVSPDTMEVLNLQDDGKVALWNQCHPFRAIVIGDRIVEVNGDQLVELNGLSQSKAILDMLKGSSAIKMVLTRHGAIASTFGVKLAKTMGTKLGVKLSEDLEVLRIDAFGAVASWNVSNPLLSIHLGDRILQAAKLVSPDKIFASLQSEGELDLLVGRVERRLDASTGGICTYKECQAAYPDADLRWANMQRVPDTPEGFPATQYAADTDCHFLAYGAPKGESRDFLASETLADSRVPQHSPGRSLARLATPAALPETVATRSSFCCPC